MGTAVKHWFKIIPCEGQGSWDVYAHPWMLLGEATLLAACRDMVTIQKILAGTNIQTTEVRSEPGYNTKGQDSSSLCSHVLEVCNNCLLKAKDP